MKTTGICTMLFSMLLGASVLQAAPGAFSLSYGGRLANANDEAEKGPVDLTVAFYKVAKGGDPITEVPKTGVTLDDGVFQVDLDLTATERAQIFGDGSAPVWVEVTDKTHKKTYSRQILTAVPYAIAAQSAQTIPIDSSTLQFGSDGKLKVIGGAGSASKIIDKNISSTPPTAGQYLSFDSASQTWVAKDPFSLPFSLPTSTTASETAIQPGKIWFNSNNNDVRFNSAGTVKTIATMDALAPYFKKDGSASLTGALGLNGVSTDPAGLVAGDKGKVWYNTTTNEVKYWNGSAAIALGAGGGGITNFNGQSGSSQSLAYAAGGTAPAWSSTGNTHTLNIPNASAAGVTGGLISQADYDNFNGKANNSISISTSGALQGGGDLTANRTLDVAPSGIDSARLAADAVTSAKIADGSIMDSDINGSAAIVDTKLATITTAGKVADSALSASVTKLGSSISLTSNVNGVLVLANGGTGMNTPGAVGNVLTSTGSGWSSAAVNDSTKLPLAGGTLSGQLMAASGTAATPGLSFASDGNTGIFSSAADTIDWATAGATRMTISPSGNVGIGTTTPTAPLEVAGGIQGNGLITSQTNVAGDAVHQTMRVSGLRRFGFGLTGLESGSSTGSNFGIWRYDDAGTAVVGSAFAVNRASGNIGIGTDSPARSLHIHSTSNTYFRLSNPSGYSEIKAGGTDLYVMNNNPGAIRTFTNSTERMTLDANGRLGIGTTTPVAALQVESTTSGFLPPRMTDSQMTAIGSPPNGTVVYNTTKSALHVYTTGTWVPFGAAGTPKTIGFGVNSASGCATMFSYPSGVTATLASYECTATLPGGLFINPPACTCTGFQGGGPANMCVLTVATTNTEVRVKLYDAAGTATAGQIHVTCVGI